MSPTVLFTRFLKTKPIIDFSIARIFCEVTMIFIDEKIKTEIKHSCDVFVAGGGFGGISAAISAAREGASVILAERGYILGGLATAGLVTIYLPLCDGMGRQVSFGIAEELLRLSVSLDVSATRNARTWLFGEGERNEKTDRYIAEFNPQLFAIHAEGLLLSLGVKILYGVSVASAVTENSRITAAIVEGKSGRYAISAKSYVDATGDSVLAKASGAKTAELGRYNTLASWYYSYGADGFKLNMLGFADTVGNKNLDKQLTNQQFSGLDDEEISDFMAIGHNEILKDVIKRRACDSTYVPTTIATTPQLRMTRRIDGKQTLGFDEKHKCFENSVGLISSWRERGPIYEVPFDIMHDGVIKNLLAVGRCVSADDAMWELIRVIPCCAVTGEAAGLAAAIFDDFSSVDINKLQRKLGERKIPLHEDEL